MQRSLFTKAPSSLMIMRLCYLKVFQRLHFDYVKFKAEEHLKFLI